MTMLAAQMYTVRDFTQTSEGIDASLKKVRHIGYEAVQMSGWKRIDPQLLKDMADKHGLEICATHVSFDEIVKGTRETIRQHKIWGTKYIGLGSMPDMYRDTEEGFCQFVKDIRPAAEEIANAGMHLIYHNHNFEFAKFDGRTGMDILLEDTDPSWFRFELDTYWITAGGGDPAEWIRKVAGRMDVVHFKDMVYSSSERRSVFAEVGEGNLNWPAIIGACAETRIRYHIVEQDACQRDPFESLAISLRYLQKMGLR
ncbi:MAG: sugar phosphate isomerase/epimerase family protein [Christensenellales bacterium]|jgi:sugar phosphate isomerase/epimerase